MFIHGEGAFCHPRMQMAEMPTEGDGMRPLRGAELDGNDFGSSLGKLGGVVFLFVCLVFVFVFSLANLSSKGGWMLFKTSVIKWLNFGWGGRP